VEAKRKNRILSIAARKSWREKRFKVAEGALNLVNHKLMNKGDVMQVKDLTMKHQDALVELANAKAKGLQRDAICVAEYKVKGADNELAGAKKSETMAEKRVAAAEVVLKRLTEQHELFQIKHPYREVTDEMRAEYENKHESFKRRRERHVQQRHKRRVLSQAESSDEEANSEFDSGCSSFESSDEDDGGLIAQLTPRFMVSPKGTRAARRIGVREEDEGDEGLYAMLTSRLRLNEGQKRTEESHQAETDDSDDDLYNMLTSRLGLRKEEKKVDSCITKEPEASEEGMFGMFKTWLKEDEEKSPKPEVTLDEERGFGLDFWTRIKKWVADDEVDRNAAQTVPTGTVLNTARWKQTEGLVTAR